VEKNAIISKKQSVFVGVPSRTVGKKGEYAVRSYVDACTDET